MIRKTFLPNHENTLYSFLTDFQTIIFLVDTQVYELVENRKWDKQTLIRSTVSSGYMYITQFVNNPGNYVCLLIPIIHI